MGIAIQLGANEGVIYYTSVTLTRNLFGFRLGIVAWELGSVNSIGTLAGEL